MYYSQDKLEKLQKDLIGILDYVKDICEKNKLQYLLIGGTALGARRHEGFIPWDDDIDIGLPRDDYEKLLIILRKNEDNFVLQDENNEPNYFCPFAKVRKLGTVFKEKISLGLYKNNGIYIDIFPIDFLSSRSSFKTIFRICNIKLLNHALRFRYCKSSYYEASLIKIIIHWALYLPFIFISRKQILKLLKINMTSQNMNIKKYAANLAGTNKILNEIMDYRTMFPVEKIKFGENLYSCPRDIDQYLYNLYGDFMKLPPKEKRRTHEPLEIKL